MLLRITEKIPCRFVIAVMVFICPCMNYTTRVNLSVNLVAMVPLSNQTYSSSQYTMEWTAYERAQVLSSFQWGYLIGAVISLLAVDRFRPKIVLLVVSLGNGILTLICPFAAKQGYLYLVMLRSAMGIISGSLFPTLMILVFKWAVEAEKNRFSCVVITGTVGTFFSWSMCGYIVDRFGWEWGFYVFGIANIITTILIQLFVFDSPEVHPRITEEEKNYIIQGRESEPGIKKNIPFLKIFTSVPCWSLFVSEFGLGWGIYFVLTVVPHYLSTALGYNTTVTSFLSALVYLTRCASAVAFGCVGDIVLKKQLLSVNGVRKVATCFTFFVPGCALLCQVVQGYPANFYVALIIIGWGFNGAVVLSCLVNAHHLTKNYVGTVSSMGTFSGTTAGILTPFFTAYIVHDDETDPSSWRPVFFVGAIVVILSGLQYLIFGSTERQPWDTIENKLTEEKNNSN